MLYIHIHKPFLVRTYGSFYMLRQCTVIIAETTVLYLYDNSCCVNYSPCFSTPQVIVRDFIALLFYTIQFRLKGRCNMGSRHESAEWFCLIAPLKKTPVIQAGEHAHLI